MNRASNKQKMAEAFVEIDKRKLIEDRLNVAATLRATPISGCHLSVTITKAEHKLDLLSTQHKLDVLTFIAILLEHEAQALSMELNDPLWLGIGGNDADAPKEIVVDSKRLSEFLATFNAAAGFKP